MLKPVIDKQKVVNMNSVNSDSKSRFVFFGSPLIDLTAEVDRTLLRKYDLEPDNAYVIDDKKRAIFGEVRDWSVQIGGSVTNTVRMFTKLRGFPGDVTYLGSVGKDINGHFIKNELNKEGLGGDLMEIDGGSTGKVAVLLCEKTRTLVTDLGASQCFSMDKSKWKKIREISLVYFSGFFIGVSFTTLSQVLEKNNKIVAFNLGAPFLCANYPKEMIYLYQKSSLVFGNEREHRAFAKITNMSHHDGDKLTDIVTSTNQLLGNKSRVTIVTRGAGTVLVFHDDMWEEFEVEDLSDEKIVDTSGAGDAFVGGYLARFVEGDSIANCVRSGMRAARCVIQTIGFNI